LVDRTVPLIGQKVDPQDRTGLIWHTQGAGKSLTIICAASKLRRHPKLNNPTVLIVVDRRDLKMQISDDFDACDYPNVEKVTGVTDLKRRLRAEWRGTLITTIQCFQKMQDVAPRQRDNIISLIDECHRSQKGKGKESFAMTMRVKLPNAFRYGFTGTPIDRTMINTHRDFGPRKEGVQERYLSYYGIKRAIRDRATIEVHYRRDRVPFQVDEEALNVGFEKMCEEMELDDEATKAEVQRKESRWKGLARDPRRIKIVVDKLVKHFLAYVDPCGLKALLVAVDRKACSMYKDALDARLKELGHPPEWSDVIISAGQNDPPELDRFHYDRKKTDELIDYFRLTEAECEAWNWERYGGDYFKRRPPLKLLIVCDRLLTGFNAPILQVMYLDKPLRDHNLLQAVARTNRRMPELHKRTGIVVDYFGVFRNLEKALNFDENVREEALIDWQALKDPVPAEVDRCMQLFEGITIEDTRDCLLAALRRLRDPDAARNFEHNFKSVETLWEAVSPDPCLYPHRLTYTWLCGIYVAHRRRQAGEKVTREELAAKTRKLIQENITFMSVVESSPVYKIDANYLTKLEDLPTPADKAAMLEAALTRELAEDKPGFEYRKLGERLKQIKKERDASDKAAAKRLGEYEAIADRLNQLRAEPERLGLPDPIEYGLFCVLREHAAAREETVLVTAAKSMIAHLRRNDLLHSGWSTTKGGRMRVGPSLLAESWKPEYVPLGFDQDDPDPPFVSAAVEELAKNDR